jgi:ketosteroid isomerase-like protein
MRTLPSICLVLIFIAVLFCGCQPAPIPGLSAADQQAIRQTTDQAIKIANSSADWNAYTKLYYAQDAIVNPPNALAIKGHDAIIAMFKSFPAISDFKVEFLEVNGAGNIAYVYGTYSMVLTPPGGKPESDKGKYVEVWKRQADGSWKVAIDTFNSDLPLPTPEKKK